MTPELRGTLREALLARDEGGDRSVAPGLDIDGATVDALALLRDARDWGDEDFDSVGLVALWLQGDEESDLRRALGRFLIERVREENRRRLPGYEGGEV